MKGAVPGRDGKEAVDGKPRNKEEEQEEKEDEEDEEDDFQENLGSDEEWRKAHVQRFFFWAVVAAVCAALIYYLIQAEQAQPQQHAQS